MQTYFFNIFNRTGDAIDDEGTPLESDAAARDWAIEGIRSIVAEEAKDGRIDMNGRVDVTDGDGNVVMTIRFEEAVEICRGND